MAGRVLRHLLGCRRRHAIRLALYKGGKRKAGIEITTVLAGTTDFRHNRARLRGLLMTLHTIKGLRGRTSCGGLCNRGYGRRDRPAGADLQTQLRQRARLHLAQHLANAIQVLVTNPVHHKAVGRKQGQLGTICGRRNL